jgi:hypothetical protein
VILCLVIYLVGIFENLWVIHIRRDTLLLQKLVRVILKTIRHQDSNIVFEEFIVEIV